MELRPRKLRWGVRKCPQCQGVGGGGSSGEELDCVLNVGFSSVLQSFMNPELQGWVEESLRGKLETREGTQAWLPVALKSSQ